MWHITSVWGRARPGQPNPPPKPTERKTAWSPTPHFYRRGLGQPGHQRLMSIGQTPQGKGATSFLNSENMAGPDYCKMTLQKLS